MPLINAPDTPFRFRIRSNHKLSDGRSSLKIGILFQDLQVGQHKDAINVSGDIGSTLWRCASKMATF
jgi:hypothetical protein